MIMHVRLPYRLVVAAAAWGLTACGSLQAYEGERLGPTERAIVRADPAMSAGLPVEVILRRVDGYDVPLSKTRVELEPGLHRFVVDCRVPEAGVVTRFVIDDEVSAGRSYRLAADATSRGCREVALQRD